jgi:hypothetical protein
MAALEPTLIAGRSVVPELVVQERRLLVRVSIGLGDRPELIGSAVRVDVAAGATLLRRLSGPPPDSVLPKVSTGAVTAYADFVFDNPEGLIPTAIIVRIEDQSASFDLADEAIVDLPPPSPRGLSGTFSLVRPDDLLNLEVEAIGLRLDSSNAKRPMLAPADPSQPTLLIFRFPPQTIVEEAFYEAGGENNEQKTDPAVDVKRKDDPAGHLAAPAPAGQLRARFGGTTRLVFRVPAGVAVPFTLEGLLDWSAFELVVAPIADVAPDAAPPVDALAIRPPAPTETTLQLPYRLHLSPSHDVTWDHARRVVNHKGRAELWHTRLALRARGGQPQRTDEHHPAPLRAIWSPDYDPVTMPSPADLFPLERLTAMSKYDRHQIVVLTSAFRGYAATVFKLYVPQPIRASLLMLSPLGGWLRSFGMWDPPYKILPTRIIREQVENIFSSRVIRAAGGRDMLQPPPAEAAPGSLVRAADGAAISGIETRANDALVFALPRYRLGQQLDLSQWTHIAAQARDHYVRIVYEGKLKEIGHRASLVKVTERRFEEAPDTGAPVAYLRQYMYLVVREPEKDYRREGLENEGRGMPLKRVRLTTLVTPHIEYPYPSPKNPSNLPTGPEYNPAAVTDRSFWVMVGKKDFLFHGVAEDVAGNVVDFAKPLIFVPNSEQDLARVDAAFNAVENRERRAASVPAQKVTFAERGGPDANGVTNDNTSFVSVLLNFENEGVSRDKFFKPRLFKADVRVPAVEQLSGAGTSTTIRFLQRYLDHGFADAGNQTGAFAEVVRQNPAGVLESGGLPVALAAQQAGGFATPNLDVTNLTRAAGPLGGTAADALANTFNPSQVFKKGLATLFGAFDLADLLPSGDADKNAPRMEVRRAGTAVITTLDWKTAVTPPAGNAPIKFLKHDDTELKVHGEFRKEPAADVTFFLNGTLNHFEIQFFKVLQVNFSLFTFTAQTAKKTDVNVALDAATPVLFIGDLEFVEGLRKLIPPGVFGDGVSIDLIQNPLGVKAGLAITLPPASVGVFSLKNISFEAGLTIPFLDGKAVVDFGFARRDNPFLLAIAFLGGGGFFHIQLDSKGIRVLEAAFEFGAVAAIDLGVASGEVHIMAGIYFKMEKRKVAEFGNQEMMVSSLTGYLRCGGKLDVLGLISVSVEFYLSFTYVVELKKAYGRATLTVVVEVAFFSASVELTVERSFGSKGGDPTFAQLMETPAVWAEYAGAFA